MLYSPSLHPNRRCWASPGGRYTALALLVRFAAVGHLFVVVGVVSALRGCSELVGGQEKMDDRKTGHDLRRSPFFRDAPLVFFIISAFLLLIFSTFFAVVPPSGLAGVVFNSLSLGFEGLSCRVVHSLVRTSFTWPWWRLPSRILFATPELGFGTLAWGIGWSVAGKREKRITKMNHAQSRGSLS